MAKAKKAKKPKKAPEVQSTVGDLISEAFGETESLREELQDWVDNLPPSKQGGAKNDELDEAINQLETSSEPEVPEDLKEMPVVYTPYTQPRKSSRASRRDGACHQLQAVVTTLEAHEMGANEPDDVRTLIDALSEAIEEWDACEFPGMFG